MTPRDERLRAWLAEPLSDEVVRALERLLRSEDVVRVAVMPDVHLAHDVCIGTVIASRSLLYPSAVGGDIGCGMAAVRFDAPASRIDGPTTAARLLAGLNRRVPFIRHPTRAAPELPPALAEARLSDASLERLKSGDGCRELGTLGSGNHFLDLQADEEGALWLMVHTGSRALGQAIRDHHLGSAGGGRSAPSSSGGLRSLDAGSEAGRAYLQDHDWAVAWAVENRRVLVDAAAAVVAEELGAAPDPDSRIECVHNHVGREAIEGATLWVHRKGAIPAHDGEPGIIPGSMGAPSFHVSGRGVAAALYSSSHGAGRALGRSEAARRISPREFAREVSGVWYDQRMAARLRDEAPSAYKDVHAVLRAERDLIRVVRTLRPVLSYKGG